jgi:hypothetical protein
MTEEQLAAMHRLLAEVHRRLTILKRAPGRLRGTSTLVQVRKSGNLRSALFTLEWMPEGSPPAREALPLLPLLPPKMPTDHGLQWLPEDGMRFTSKKGSSD